MEHEVRIDESHESHGFSMLYRVGPLLVRYSGPAPTGVEQPSQSVGIRCSRSLPGDYHVPSVGGSSQSRPDTRRAVAALTSVKGALPNIVDLFAVSLLSGEITFLHL